MSLKQSVVIVSEFTFKTKSGGGSRGATPGAYAYDYMARGEAVEQLTPVKLHEYDSMDSRYAVRSDAVEKAGNVQDMKSAFRDYQQTAGVAFGYGHVSLPQDKLVAACDDIQSQFDNGKTVFKTVLSFDEEYLKSIGVIQEDFEHHKKGDYRGQIDQMKLRMAVMAGVDKLSERGFDDLRYVGVLHVNTHQPHCHLAMVDCGEGRVINSKTGAQKGKLSKEDFKVVRAGIDDYLKSHAYVKHLSASIYDDSRNVQCYVKDYTHAKMRERTLPQFLIACLPEDRNLWRASNTSQAMRKPNAIVREYVTDILSQPDSGYSAALDKLNSQLQERRDKFGMSEEQYHALYQGGRRGIVEDCMNSVYGALKQIPDEELRVQTPAMSRMSMDFESMAAARVDSNADKMIEFGFKLRSYASRQDFHRKEAEKYHRSVARYEAQENIAPEAMSVINFMRFEEEYNSMLLSKYQHFMSFLPPDSEYEDQWKAYQSARDRFTRFELMSADQNIKTMSVAEAEKYGREHYNLNGAGLRIADPAAFARRGEKMKSDLNVQRSELEFNLSMRGLGVEEDWFTGEVSVGKNIKYDFDDVKALDLHHLEFDFGEDVALSKRNLDVFLDATKRRVELFDAAAEYLRNSGQEEAIQQLPVQDIQKMADMADRLQELGKLPSAINNYMQEAQAVRRNPMTTSLDIDYNQIMSNAVRERLNYQAEQGDTLE